MLTNEVIYSYFLYIVDIIFMNLTDVCLITTTDLLPYKKNKSNRQCDHVGWPPPPIIEEFKRVCGLQLRPSFSKPLTQLTPLKSSHSPSLLLHICMICTTAGPKCTFHNSCILYCSNWKCYYICLHHSASFHQLVRLVRVTLTLQQTY